MRIESFSLLLFFLFGFLIFLISSLPNFSPQDLKALLIYISPLCFSATFFVFSLERPDLFHKIVKISALIWISVGLAQYFISPNLFAGLVGGWGEAAGGIVESGRGVLGLAPEPTHFGFHMLLLASILYILKSNRLLIALCIFSSIFLARSSSAILAMAIGLFLCLLVRSRILFFLLSISILLFFVFGRTDFTTEQPGEDANRILLLLSLFLNNPTDFLMIDGSINLRIGGIIVGYDLILDSWLLPNGMSNLDWIARSREILNPRPWLYDISDSGIPSGYLIVIYQVGFIGFMFLLPAIYRISSAARSALGTWIVFTALSIFLGQYMISNPGFGLLYGCAAAEWFRKRQAASNFD
ncbi:MAG: hypothetical protein KGM99_20125 [Burkholderiales bacterium]|nr:hypothetical protein [Burkholderiales bacterium]